MSTMSGIEGQHMRTFFQGTIYQKRGLFFLCISLAYSDILFSVPLKKSKVSQLVKAKLRSNYDI